MDWTSRAPQECGLIASMTLFSHLHLSASSRSSEPLIVSEVDIPGHVGWYLLISSAFLWKH